MKLFKNTVSIGRYGEKKALRYLKKQGYRTVAHNVHCGRNEIDLILMRENLPILASCKNTVPQNEHLYEIMIMAKHYGGYFATPALFSSGRATESIRKRAKEMGIVLIDGIRFKTPEQMKLLLQKKFQ